MTTKRLINVARVALCGGFMTVHFVQGQMVASSSPNAAKERGHILLTPPLSELNSQRLRAVLVEVRYGPGEGSHPHSHPCPVIGYVLEGAIRTQVKGEPEAIYNAGQSFYEAPNGVHLLAANASNTRPAKFVAFFVCDHEAPLSLPAKGESK